MSGTKKQTNAEWQRGLDTLRVRLSSQGTLPVSFIQHYNILSNGGPDALDEIFESLPQMMTEMAHGFQSSDATVSDVIQTSLCPIALLHYAFRYSAGDLSEDELDDEAQTKMQRLLTDFQTMETCLSNWQTDDSIACLEDIQKRHDYSRFEEATESISRFMTEVTKAQESIKQSMESMCGTLDTLKQTLELGTLLQDNNGLLKRIYSEWGGQMKTISTHLKEKNREAILGFSRLTVELSEKALVALEKLTALDVDYSQRDRFSQEEIQAFVQDQEAGKEASVETKQAMTECMKAVNVWEQRSKLVEVSKMMVDAGRMVGL